VIETGLGRDRYDFLSPGRENLDWRFEMRLRMVSVAAAIVALGWSVQCARAGAIRFAGEEVSKGSVAVAQVTADAAGAAAEGIGDAGKATGPVLKDGAVAVEKGAVSAPGVAARGTKAAASKVWKAVW
jgi:hypothetical protein